MNMTLNEHGIKMVRSGIPITGIKTERDIFTLLRLGWVEPPDRTGPEALRHLPKGKKE
jgi:DNA polymerase/3'-5' exonuclease PolX